MRRMIVSIFNSEGEVFSSTLLNIEDVLNFPNTPDPFTIAENWTKKNYPKRSFQVEEIMEEDVFDLDAEKDGDLTRD